MLPAKKRYLWSYWIALTLILLSLNQHAAGQAAPPTSLPAPLACEDGAQTSGATYRICMPAQWNGRLIVYAHGYVAPTRPVAIPEDQMTLPGGGSVDQIATNLGYAFATSGYSANGLAVLQGVADLVDVVNIFKAQKGAPDKVLLVGVSQGGIITTLAAERHPDVFAGGLAMCGPYGSFADQINYFGDFRVLFDYFFPNVMPPTPIDVPQSLLETWETSYYSNTVRPVITDTVNAPKVDELLAVSGAPFDVAVASSKEKTIQSVLWYNVFATNDGKTKLGGQPYTNQNRTYSGSSDDTQVNATVNRFTADPPALDVLAAGYETSGKLTVPLITLHTTGDPVIPYWHATRYRGKTIAANNIALHEHIAVQRYGHCQFTSFEILAAFNRLVFLVDNPPAYQPVQRIYLPMITYWASL